MMLNWEGVTDTGEDRGLAQKGRGGGDRPGRDGAQGGRKGTREGDRPGGDGGTDPRERRCAGMGRRRRRWVMVGRWKGVDFGVLRGCRRLVLVVPTTRWDTLLLPITPRGAGDAVARGRAGTSGSWVSPWPRCLRSIFCGGSATRHPVPRLFLQKVLPRAEVGPRDGEKRGGRIAWRWHRETRFERSRNHPDLLQKICPAGAAGGAEPVAKKAQGRIPAPSRSTSCKPGASGSGPHRSQPRERGLSSWRCSSE